TVWPVITPLHPPYCPQATGGQMSAHRHPCKSQQIRFPALPFFFIGSLKLLLPPDYLCVYVLTGTAGSDLFLVPFGSAFLPDFLPCPGFLPSGSNNLP